MGRAKTMISEIQKRIMESIGSGANYDRALGLALYNGARLDDIRGIEDLARWYEGAPKEVKWRFVDEFVLDGNDDLRVCTNCGCFMTEGYLLGIQYACSDRCAIELYDGDEAQLREDIRQCVDNDDDNDCFWTEW